VHELAVRYSFPAYLAGLFVAKYGTHKATAIMEACNEEPAMTVRVNTLSCSREDLLRALLEAGFTVKEALLAPDALIVEAGPDAQSLFDSEPFKNGWFYVQDEGSQLVAHLVDPAPGERIMDMCSAPGGKTTHLAELANGGALITATDYSNERLKLVTENMERLKTPGVKVVTLDDVLAENHAYDAVLVDAPCSGMGTIRRNPEIRYRINEEELARQAVRQRGVLEQAAPLVQQGGRLIYSTCSMSEVENKNVIDAFLRTHPEFSIRSPVEGDAESGALTELQRPDGFVATWPLYPALDGFEAVVLVKQ
jgi:16S rRNA (cytosine967-C5)-methyltransferase